MPKSGFFFLNPKNKRIKDNSTCLIFKTRRIMRKVSLDHGGWRKGKGMVMGDEFEFWFVG